MNAHWCSRHDYSLGSMTTSSTPQAGDAAAVPPSGAKPPPSMSEHVRQGLREQIIEGVLGPGERINEETVARAYGVSRTPIREALRFLESEGLIVHQRGRGATVADLATARDAWVLFRVRVDLESSLARRAAERITPHSLENVAATQSEFRQLSLSGADGEAHLRRLVALDADFHMGIYRAAEANLLLAVVISYWGQLRRELNRRDHDPEHPLRFIPPHEESLEQHDRLLQALAERDGDLAESVMAQHIQHVWRIVQSEAR
jgi:DNA-binding GntR family transcriptional regulator